MKASRSQVARCGEGQMVCSRRILVLATGMGGGNWPPLAAVTLGLHRTGHAVTCYGDATIGRDFAAAAAGVEAVPAEHNLRTFIVRWQEAGGVGPSPLRTWAEASAPSVGSLATDFQPQALVSELFTIRKRPRGSPAVCRDKMPSLRRAHGSRNSWTRTLKKEVVRVSRYSKD